MGFFGGLGSILSAGGGLLSNGSKRSEHKRQEAAKTENLKGT